MEFFSLEAVIALVTLAGLEIILGFDNLVVIAILTDKLPPRQRPMARRLGLMFALVTRVLLLTLAFYAAHLSQPFGTLAGHPVSWRDVLLLAGGIFLIYKGGKEIYEKIHAAQETSSHHRQFSSVPLVVMQIGLIDIVFSFDSVMTAIGLAEQLWVMVLAIIVAMAAMLLAVNVISDFVSRHPRIKMLALCYMLLIGAALILESLHIELPKVALYLAMGFSFLVEVCNMATHRRHTA
jgi:predicted tellurium resistance membrane protein TerC